jgi:endonuclease-3
MIAQVVGYFGHKEATTVEEPNLSSLQQRISEVANILLPLWPDEKPLIHSSNCFELLCAVILSAQCTDEQVNAVTPALFASYPNPNAMALAEVEDVERLIRSVGFFHTKARHLVLGARKIMTEHGGKVPSSMEDLLCLPGVGRKTANLVISSCFGVPGIIVDTHASRLVYRLGLHENRDPEAIENKIRQNLDESLYTAFSHALNRQGKYLCRARNPVCIEDPSSCPLEKLCPRRGL